MLLTDPFFHSEIDNRFSDSALIGQWLRIEVALAAVQAESGLIDADVVKQIETAVADFEPDMPSLQMAMEKSGVPIAELVRQMRGHVGAPAGDFIHFGATTQDIIDTGMVIQLKSCFVDVLMPTLRRLIDALARLTETHRETVMAGRTHSQQAVLLTFGLKAANWLAPLIRQYQSFSDDWAEVQLGGAAGTLAPLGNQGIVVKTRLAEELGLSAGSSVWHTQRDRLAALASWLSVTTGALAKMGQDVILMSQSEIGELFESADPTRGGSSTMPQKRNPMVSEALVAIHRSNVGHLSSLHQALVHEHERATGSWQVEWLVLARMVSHTAAALEKGAWLAENLVVNTEKIERNLKRSNGMMLAEAASFMLAEHMSRKEAKTAVKNGIETATKEDRHLIDVLSEQLSTLPIDWAMLKDEKNHLGVTHQLIDQIVAESKTLE